ncbi:MAG: apolipoprotein N-acyltransferase [Flavobacteriales bacterium]|nr:apolipoprotein N-acyltransferase [Flavobacteriales bacterium]MBK6943627.1 apolipoprotein N-acyltransferase [Flavobacteriales bacterium]MBK7239838.1 apolipoprotein N-acyltransferase [Flavobacteriales bacterium]MBP9138567.1 apolipoprotein N-acyltransferase [Flavobacteriales bacterium]HQV52978.1 apolipoprotein N-acyltransferase [Flavobacteriales bacterium]
MEITRARVAAWAAGSGLLWSLAWPYVGGFTWVAFFAWLPLLHAERLHSQRTANKARSFFPYVWIATLIWNGLGAWWFYNVSEPLDTRLVSGTAPLVVNSLLMTIPWWLKRVVNKRFGMQWATWAFIVFWIAFERLHHGWDLQWPWFSIGNVFGTQPAWVQWYEITGMLGGTLWVLLVTLILDQAIVAWLGNAPRKRILANVSFVVALVAIPLSISLARFYTYQQEGSTAEVVVVQPNIDPYNEKFGGVDALIQLDRMLSLAKMMITDSTRLVLLPETALQENATVDGSSGTQQFLGLWENDLAASKSVQRIKKFQAEFPHVSILAGMNSDSLYPATGPRPMAARPLYRDIPPGMEAEQRWYVAYNAALWVPAKGPIESYHKSKLVAGVEQLPFENVLGPIGALVVDLGGTTGSLGKQKIRSVLKDGNSNLRVIPAICYESEFGEHIAAHVRNGGNLLAVITNDGWWGDSPGYKQHITFATIRAIEMRRDVARSANTGISCFSDQRGVLRDHTDWWVPTVIRSTVNLNEKITFYAAHGDLIGLVAMFFAAGFFVALVVKRFMP